MGVFLWIACLPRVFHIIYRCFCLLWSCFSCGGGLWGWSLVVFLLMGVFVFVCLLGWEIVEGNVFAVCCRVRTCSMEVRTCSMGVRPCSLKIVTCLMNVWPVKVGVFGVEILWTGCLCCVFGCLMNVWIVYILHKGAKTQSIQNSSIE